MRDALKLAEGSVQGIAELPDALRAIYRTAWEMPMRSLIDMAADRGAFIDQSQSLNLFIESPNIGQLSSMYIYAWKKGLKTTYYLRSRPATRIAKATVAGAAAREPTRRRSGRAARSRTPRAARPASERRHRPARLLDPGLRPDAAADALPARSTRCTATRSRTPGRWRRSTSRPTSATCSSKMTPAERHLIQRLVAFFATGDSIVANNLVLNLYKHINAPEARMYLSRQLYEEALHVQFYLTLLDTYVPDPARARAGVRRGREHPVDPAQGRVLLQVDRLDPGPAAAGDARRSGAQFLLNLICFAACIEGLFFFGAFAYVYFLRSRGLLHGLAAGTNWVFRDESAHMAFAFEVVRTVRARGAGAVRRRPAARRCAQMIDEAIECETQFAEDLLSRRRRRACRVSDMRQYLEYCADQRLAQLGLPQRYGAKNPFAFMDLQDVQELTNFFERRVSAYQVGVRARWRSTPRSRGDRARPVRRASRQVRPAAGARRDRAMHAGRAARSEWRPRRIRGSRCAMSSAACVPCDARRARVRPGRCAMQAAVSARWREVGARPLRTGLRRLSRHASLPPSCNAWNLARARDSRTRMLSDPRLRDRCDLVVREAFRVREP